MVSIEWRSLGGRFRQISAGLGGLWGISETGDVFYRVGTFENARSPGTGWWQVEGTIPALNTSSGIDHYAQGKLVQLSVGSSVVWAVDVKGEVWCRYGIDIDHVAGTRWLHVPTHRPFKQVSVDRLGRVWAVDATHEVYFRIGACLENKAGTFWKKVGDRRMSQVDTGKSGVWAVDENMQVYHRLGTFGESGSIGSDWVKVSPDTVLLKQVSSGGEDMVVGVTRQGEPYMRTGLSMQNHTGNDWKRLKGQLLETDVYGYMAWGVDSNLEPVFSSCLPFSQPPVRTIRDHCF